MKSVTATLTVDVDVEEHATDEDIQNDARYVMIDLLQDGADITIESGGNQRRRQILDLLRYLDGRGIVVTDDDLIDEAINDYLNYLGG